MNVLLTGASGFVGGHLAHALRAAGYVVIAARREIEAGSADVQADFSRDLSARDWLPKLAGIDAVVNAVGILREHGTQTFERIHKRAPQAMFTACVAAGVRRIVQISALGADRGTTRYFLSKRAADDYLATLPLEWTIVRPALIFGPGGANARLFTTLARLPLAPLPGHGTQRMQPMHIDDLTESIVRVLGDAAFNRVRIDLMGPQPFTLRELLVTLRSTMHLSAPRFVPIPMPLVRAGARVAGWIPTSPLDSETLAMLETGTTGDPTATCQLLGRSPRPVSEWHVAKAVPSLPRA
jgi:uncharacterized protein YbjT (DUF2867 family)